MATLSKPRLADVCRVAAINLFDRTLGRHIPRRCTVIAVGLILAGLFIPLLMAVALLPSTYLLGFGALVLLATGGGLLLGQCGEM